MAVARKSDVDNSGKGGWFGQRRSRRRDISQRTSTPTSTTASQTSSSSLPARNTTNSKSQLKKTSKSMMVPSTSKPESYKLKHQVQATSKTNLSSKSNSSLRSDNTTIPVMSASEAMPVWLLRLQGLQRNTSVLTFLLVAATLVAYGWTVYSQQLWSQSYRRLQNLQRQERQLTVTNGVLESKFAADAEKPNAGLVSPSPSSMIFIPAAPGGNTNLASPTLPPNLPTQQQTSTPVGY